MAEKMNKPMMTKAPRARLARMVDRVNEAGLAGRGVGVGRGTSVGVGEAARRNGVGICTPMEDSGVEVTTGVGVNIGASFWMVMGTVASWNVPSARATRKRRM